MAKIYAKPSFKASSVNADFYRFLEKLDDDVVVMLEFQSPGPKRRQVDCAILSPGGIDLVEVKDKRGVIQASPNGRWKVTLRDETQDIFNIKDGIEENPYDQAERTADDVKKGIKETFKLQPHVYPMVLVPRRNPASRFEPPHYVVKAANGMDEFKLALRAMDRSLSNPTWRPSSYSVIPEKLGLGEVGLAYLEGKVTNARTNQTIPGAIVTFTGDGLKEELELRVSSDGHFKAVVPVGEVNLRVIANGFLPNEYPHNACSGSNTLYIRLEPEPQAQTQDIHEEVAELKSMWLQFFEEQSRRNSELAIDQKLAAGFEALKQAQEAGRADQQAVYDLLLETLTARNPGTPINLEPILSQLAAIQQRLESILSNPHSTPAQRQEARAELVLLSRLNQVAMPTAPAAPPIPVRAIPVERRAHKPKRSFPPRYVGLAVTALVCLSLLGFWLGRPTATPQPGSVSTEKPFLAPSPSATELAKPKDAQPRPSTLVRVTKPTAQSKPQAPSPIPKAQPVASNPKPAAREPQAAPKATPKRSPEVPAVRAEPSTRPSGTARQTVAKPTENPVAPKANSSTIRSPAKTQAEPLPGEPLPGEPLASNPVVRSPMPSDDSLPGEPLESLGGVNPSGKYTCPSSHPVKGNVNYAGARYYHLPDEQFYSRTAPETCFSSAEQAESFGFIASPN